MQRPATKAATIDIAQLFNNALELHRAGKIAQAKTIYLQLMPKLGQHSDLLRLLGAAEFQLGNHQKAVDLLDKSLKIDPKQADALNNRGNALNALGRLEEALASFDQAIALQPEYIEAYSNRGNVLRAMRRFHEALNSYDKVIAVNANIPECHNNRGNTLRELNRMREALQSFEKAIALNPDYAEAYSNRGNVMRETGRMREAMEDYDRAIAMKSVEGLGGSKNDAELFNNRGNGLRDLKRFEEAIENYDKAIAANPDYAEVHNSRGTALHDLCRFEEALASYDRAIALDPNHSDFYSNRGITLTSMRRFEEALADLNTAIELKPKLAHAHYHIGNALNGLNRPQEAEQSFKKAIEMEPALVEAHNNRSNTLRELKQLDAAAASLDAALAISPEFADGYWNKSVVKLLNGEFEEGWRLYEWRWKTKPFADKKKETDKPLWLGEQSIAGKILLVYPEQGFGDFIQFVRYVPLLEAMGATVILEVPAPLMSLMGSMQGNFTMIPKDSPMPNVDYHCPVMSLPLALKTTVDTVPAHIPYLFANPEKRAVCQQKLGPKSRKRVGVVWSGMPKHLNDHNRSLAFAAIRPLFDAPCEFHALQKEFREADAPHLPSIANLKIHASDLANFEDTAALIAEMDVVISVDTSVAHLAAAMGKPTWILLPYAPDYRWLLDRADSPWYPTASLLRQTNAGEWSPVIADAVQRLALLP